MKANDTQIRIFLEGSKQFVVPLFQRTYSWKRENIRKLWEDIQETQISNNFSHFFGSFVTMPVPSSASGVSTYTIIDGQQRLTTMFILLAALRNRIIELWPDYEKKDEINELYLVNKYHPEQKHKVVPTQADRDLFFAIIDELEPPLDHDHLLVECYKFFRDKMVRLQDVEQLISVKNTILSKFCVVDIRLEDEEDPYLIFESLNATGTPLTQADLVRNYLFMRIGHSKQQEVYERIWFPMQQQLQDHLEPFIRHYLAMEGTIPNFRRIYGTFKETADRQARVEQDVIDLMVDLSEFSGYCYKFLHPESEDQEELKVYFQKLKRLEVTTSYPLLLKLYEDHAKTRMSLDAFCECLRAIETYIVRRAVCGIPTNVLNRYFPTIYDSLDQNNLVDSLKTKLGSGTGARRMPDDDEFKRCLMERKLFGNRVLQYLLEEIEKHENKEVVNFEELQIEHIMPRTLSDEWKEELGSDWELIHRKYLDTLGNLTLTGYNPEYSNKLFAEKRDIDKGFKDSGLQLNRDLAKLERWTAKEIVDRAEKLSQTALKIWRQ